VLHV
jgi:hypothetical protein